MRGKVDKCLEVEYVKMFYQLRIVNYDVLIPYNIRNAPTRRIYKHYKAFVEKYEQDLRTARTKSPFSEGMTDIIKLRNEINNYQYRMKDGFGFYADTVKHRKKLLKEMLKKYYKPTND